MSPPRLDGNMSPEAAAAVEVERGLCGEWQAPGAGRTRRESARQGNSEVANVRQPVALLQRVAKVVVHIVCDGARVKGGQTTANMHLLCKLAHVGPRWAKEVHIVR